MCGMCKNNERVVLLCAGERPKAFYLTACIGNVVILNHYVPVDVFNLSHDKLVVAVDLCVHFP